MRGLWPYLLIAALLTAAPGLWPATWAGPSVSYLHSLSNFNGRIPYGPVKIFVDDSQNEIFVAESNIVRVFNGSGMEVSWFGFDPALGLIRDLAADETGDVFLLSADISNPAQGVVPFLARCNYRGEFRERIEFKNLPAGFESFQPSRLTYRPGRFYLVDEAALRLAVVDAQGRFQQGFDLAALIDLEKDKHPDTEIFGFNLDEAGNILFTIPVLFRVFQLTPGGAIRSFGKPGSAPGSFGIVGGVAADRSGNIYVSDRLRSVVMVFDKNFSFLTEFGGFGDRPENLIRPGNIALGATGKLYVTQLRNRGVSVFSVGVN